MPFHMIPSGLQSQPRLQPAVCCGVRTHCPVPRGHLTSGICPLHIQNRLLLQNHRLRSCRHVRSSQVFSQLQVTESQTEQQAAPAQSGPYNSLPEMWPALAERHRDQIAAEDPHQTPVTKLTFRELDAQIKQFAAGLKAVGLAQGDKVSLFSENSSRWLTADQGIMLCGAADAVRGASSPADELAFITRQSDSTGLIVQDSATLHKLMPYIGIPGSSPVASASGNGSNGSSTNGHSNGSNGNGVQSSSQQAPLSECLKFVAVLWGEPSQKDADALNCPALSFAALVEKGKQNLTSFEAQPVSIAPTDLATLVYTSGTTGNPKGVMLTHSNLLYQLHNLKHFLQPQPSDASLSLLPPWHIYERSCGYFIYSCGMKQVYTNIRRFREDLTKFPPNYFVCVPLVIDTLHTKVKAAIKRGSAVKRNVAAFFFALSAAFIRARRVKNGVDLKWAVQPRPLLAYLWAVLAVAALAPLHKLAQKLVYGKIREALGVRSCVVSGGGSLQPHLDEFYEVLDLTVLNGWGLSETSPVLACRAYTDGIKAVRGSVGKPIPGTSLRVVDPETYQDVPDGQQGLLLAKGPGVMKGYYNNPQGTQKAFQEGWFDTGDLGWRAPEGVAGSNMAGVIVLTGRAKDTIVLSSGENIEPGTIEDAAVCSPLIKFCVLLGQDRRSLGALIVPDAEAFEELGPIADKQKYDMIKAELDKVSENRPLYERITAFVIINEPFSPDNGTLTRSMKVRRDAVMQKYAGEVDSLRKRLR